MAYVYLLKTADLAGEIRLPDDKRFASCLLQQGTKYKLTLVIENLREDQLKAIMTIANALDGWKHSLTK